MTDSAPLPSDQNDTGNKDLETATQVAQQPHQEQQTADGNQAVAVAAAAEDPSGGTQHHDQQHGYPAGYDYQSYYAYSYGAYGAPPGYGPPPG